MLMRALLLLSRVALDQVNRAATSGNTKANTTRRSISSHRDPVGEPA
jgi:hypothetical protein